MVTEHNASTTVSYNSSNNSVPAQNHHSKSNGTVYLHGNKIHSSNSSSHNNTNHHNQSTLVQIDADTVTKGPIFTVHANMGHQNTSTTATSTTNHKSSFFSKNPLKSILKNNGSVKQNSTSGATTTTTTINVCAGDSLPFVRAKVGILKQSSSAEPSLHHYHSPHHHQPNLERNSSTLSSSFPLTDPQKAKQISEIETGEPEVDSTEPPTCSAKSQITIPIQFKSDYPKANNTTTTTAHITGVAADTSPTNTLLTITGTSNERSSDTQKMSLVQTSLANSSKKLTPASTAATPGSAFAISTTTTTSTTPSLAGSLIAKKFGLRNGLSSGSAVATSATAKSVPSNSLQPLSANRLQVPSPQAPPVMKAITARNKLISPSAAQSQLSSLTSPSGISNQSQPAYYLGASTARISDLRKILNPEVEKEDSFKKLSETIENCDCFEFNLNNAAKLITVLVLLATLILVIKALKGDR